MIILIAGYPESMVLYTRGENNDEEKHKINSLFHPVLCIFWIWNIAAVKSSHWPEYLKCTGSYIILSGSMEGRYHIKPDQYVLFYLLFTFPAYQIKL